MRPIHTIKKDIDYHYRKYNLCRDTLVQLAKDDNIFLINTLLSVSCSDVEKREIYLDIIYEQIEVCTDRKRCNWEMKEINSLTYMNDIIKYNLSKGYDYNTAIYNVNNFLREYLYKNPVCKFTLFLHVPEDFYPFINRYMKYINSII